MVQAPAPVGATELPVIVQLPLFDEKVTAPVPDPPPTETVCGGPPKVRLPANSPNSPLWGRLLMGISSVTCGAGL